MSDFERVNEATYRRADVVAAYAGQDNLQEGEARVLERVGDLGALRMLDIGVGGGRTTAHFVGRVASYAGIDYSPELVAATRARFPDADIAEGDARALAFNDESFDFVLFSFNGIDYVSGEGRLQVLREIRRVLAPGGSLLFATHNRDYERVGLMPWQKRRPSRTMLKQSAVALWQTRRRRVMRRSELVAADHAIVNDDAHGWALLTYYISSVDQVAQLRAAGYAEVETFDQWGRPDSGDEASIWRHYLAR